MECIVICNKITGVQSMNEMCVVVVTVDNDEDTTNILILLLLSVLIDIEYNIVG